VVDEHSSSPNSGKFRLPDSTNGTADSFDLNSSHSIAGMAAANGLVVDALVFYPGYRSDLA
jgi:hypothetical protein